MPEFANHIRASFEPSDTKLLTTSPTSKLLVESPTLASSLSQIFPFLLLIDNFLETITWTNDDHYRNFLIMTLYTCVVMYWNIVSQFFLPIILVLIFSFFVWLISSVVYDSKYEEKPTIEEVLYTLHNITVRSEMILRPIKKFPFTAKNFKRLFIVTTLLTPLQWVLVKTVLPPQKFLLIAGIFVFSFNSPHAVAIRKLLWRSLYLRVLVIYITGVNFKVNRAFESQEALVISSSSASEGDESEILTPVLSNFKVVKKKMISPTRLKQSVVFEVLENERRWFGIGWSSMLYPNERPNFCFEKTMEVAPSITTEPDDFPFPVFENDVYSYQWNWSDESWKVDQEFNRSKSIEGWVYYDNSWEHPRYQDGFSKYTRSRKWARKATLVIDKYKTVYDE